MIAFQEFARYVRLLFRMARPAQLLAVFLVYSWGAILALKLSGSSNLGVFLMGLLPLILISISIHYANEYADYETDAMTVRTPYSGGSGALQELQVSRAVALLAAWVALISGLSFALGFYVAGYLPSTALLILALGGFLGWMYSLTPLALAWRGWGEVTNAFLGGILLQVYGFSVLVGYVDWRVLLVSLPFGLLVFLNLLATTWPDRDADRMVGKYTLATHWSVKRLRLIYAVVTLIAYLAVINTANLLPLFAVIGSLLLIPFSIWAWRAYTRQHSPTPSVSVMVAFLLIQIVGWWFQ